MIRITALNEETDEDSESEEEVTKEALEEIALQQYAKTLELQKKGNLKDALQLLKDLLDTELLDGIYKPDDLRNSGISRPLLNLKYLCYRNIASLSAQLGDREAAIEAYLRASELDDSDVTLWFRLGKICMQLEKFEMASYAFERGVECNPKHWPCLDNLITLLLGLGNRENCIFYIYDALELDQDYCRGKLYRHHIFTEYPYILEYLSFINPLYKWVPKDDSEILGGEHCKKLMEEAFAINKVYTEQIINKKPAERLPVLTLNKPVEKLTWLSLGESLTDMHLHMSANLLSHACVVEISMPLDEKVETVVNSEPMEIENEENKLNDGNVLIENSANVVRDEEGQKEQEKVDEEADKTIVEVEKMEVEQEAAQNQENMISKKITTRRRGSSLSFLEQWEWCNKRRSSRKKTNNKQDRVDETIYDTLKRLLPPNLEFDEMKPEKVKDFKTDDSLDTMDLYKLFEEKEKTVSNSLTIFNDENATVDIAYFGSDKETADVQNFIKKYVESKCDIITMVDDFVNILCKLWDCPWPKKLGAVYIQANLCSKQHIDPPLGNDEESIMLIKTFVDINVLHLELAVNLLTVDTKKEIDHELIGVLKDLCSRRHIFGDEAINIKMRYLWAKCHAFLHGNETEFALDCLYYMIYELNLMGEPGSFYALNIPNFVRHPLISKVICTDLIKALERNKKLSTVSSLYEAGRYDEVLPILQESFKHCQIQANKQDWSGMTLDWAIQLITLIETLWALDNVEETFKWAVICLHEAVKQYVICVPGNDDYEKWTLTVIKFLMTIEHILKSEGSAYFDILPEKALTRLVQDLIQIIGHQLDDSNNCQEMPIKTVVPWILLHFIFQREEDCGRGRKKNVDEDMLPEKDEVPSSLSILFIAHDYLGKKGWCCNNDGYLLFFTLNVVIPRLKSPALSSVVESVSQCLEQSIFCLFGHPTKKTKLKYLVDHNVPPTKLDWDRAQQIFELYRPDEMPEFNSYRLNSVTSETEQLFQRMLSLFPANCDPQPYYADVIAFIENRKEKLPNVTVELPFKMRDIYFLLADFYLKNNETFKALKYYTYDIIINKNRFDSWAGMALARGSLLETKLNSCETFKNEMEYLNRATAVECCFKKALEIDSSHSMLWIEYGAFVYGVHSFCSRMLKQASESLSMESFEILENRKESMLETAHKCFLAAHREWLAEYETEDKGPQDERWLHYYMLGKISEKRNDAPKTYLGHYMKASKFLMENNATYPIKINYNNPQNLSVEALEIHYRIHASILKYIEQHENKAILVINGKAFKDCLDQCAAGPFSLKKPTAKEILSEKEQAAESTVESTMVVVEKIPLERQTSTTKRELEEIPKIENDAKRMKIDSVSNNELLSEQKVIQEVESVIKYSPNLSNTAVAPITQVDMETSDQNANASGQNSGEDSKISPSIDAVQDKIDSSDAIMSEDKTVKDAKENLAEPKKLEESEPRRTSQESTTTTTRTSQSSSESSSDSSSDDSSSDSTSDSSTDSARAKAEEEKLAKAEMATEDINEIIAMCLESLEDCVNRFPQHYKALYRLAHYHFYYRKDKNVERCRDLMLSSFTARSGAKLQGLFCERKNSNFFNGIWRIPASEVDRPGSFASHMSRCVLITMEVLKEIDDHKTLLDLCLQLQRTPDAEKKYLRDSERGELSQQALSLCIRSLKGQLTKFTNQADLKTNLTERKALSSLMLDIYRAYQRVQKHVPAKSQIFATLLMDTYKLFSGSTASVENVNLLELGIKHCQALILTMKQLSNSTTATTQTATSASNPPRKVTKNVEPPKSQPLPIIPASSFLPNAEPKPTTSFSKNVFSQNVANPYMQYMPYMDRSLLSALNNIDQAAAALSYVSNVNNLAGLSGMSANTYQNNLIQSIIATGLDSVYNMQQMKPAYTQSSNTTKAKPQNVAARLNPKLAQAYPTGKLPSNVKFTTGSISKKSNNKNTSSFPLYNNPIQPLQKKAEPTKSVSLSMSTQLNPAVSQSVYNQIPVSNSSAAHKVSASNSSYASTSSGTAKPAHMTSASSVSTTHHTKPPLPHQQVSPGKTLQEKLAERQKQNEESPKNVASGDSAFRAAASAAFTGKIPSSLTITKTAKSSGQSMGNSGDENKSKKALQFEQKEVLAKPKHVIDTSEIIILDDD